MTAARLTAALADRYHIERELGAGGMATVYLAQDLKHNRQVAIKVLRPELAAVLGKLHLHLFCPGPTLRPTSHDEGNAARVHRSGDLMPGPLDQTDASRRGQRGS